jgi:hypothetical protein
MGTKRQVSTVKDLGRGDGDDQPESERVLRDLDVLEGAADDVVGGLRGSGGCTASFACGSNGNHNEVLAATSDKPENERVLRDLEVLEGEAEDVVGGARRGDCPELACGSGGNHNEVLAVTS